MNAIISRFDSGHIQAYLTAFQVYIQIQNTTNIIANT